MRILVVADPKFYEARRLKEAGRAAGHAVTVVRIEELELDYRGVGVAVRLDGRALDQAFDAVYLRYFFPYVSEGLFVAEWAASRGLRVVEPSLPGRNYVRSKTYDYWKLKDAGLPVPEGFQVMRLARARSYLESLGAPVVAKGVHGGKGRYVYAVESAEAAERQLQDDLIGFFTFQEKLEVEAEYRVIVIGGRAVGAMRKTAPSDDFRANVAVGAATEAAVLPKALLAMCERAAKTLDLGIAGVDLAIAAGRPYILEVNRMPAFSGFEEATGIDVAKTIIAYVAQDRHRRAPERRQVHALLGHHQEAG